MFLHQLCLGCASTSAFMPSWHGLRARLLIWPLLCLQRQRRRLKPLHGTLRPRCQAPRPILGSLPCHQGTRHSTCPLFWEVQSSQLQCRKGKQSLCWRRSRQPCVYLCLMLHVLFLCCEEKRERLQEFVLSTKKRVYFRLLFLDKYGVDLFTCALYKDPYLLVDEGDMEGEEVDDQLLAEQLGQAMAANPLPEPLPAQEAEGEKEEGNEEEDNEEEDEEEEDDNKEEEEQEVRASRERKKKKSRRSPSRSRSRSRRRRRRSSKRRSSSSSSRGILLRLGRDGKLKRAR